MSSKNPSTDRPSPSASFVSEFSENDDDDDDVRNRSTSPPLTDLMNKSMLTINTVKTKNPSLRRYAAQSRTNFLRSTPISPLILRKRGQSSIGTSDALRGSNLRTQKNPSDIKWSRITEKQISSITPNLSTDQQSQRSRLVIRETNNKSQLVTGKTNIQTSKKQTKSITPSIGRSTSFNTSKVSNKIFKKIN